MRAPFNYTPLSCKPLQHNALSQFVARVCMGPKPLHAARALCRNAQGALSWLAGCIPCEMMIDHKRGPVSLQPASAKSDRNKSKPFLAHAADLNSCALGETRPSS